MSANPAQGQPRKPEGPRRVRHGIKFRRKEGLQGLPWFAQAFVDAVEGRAALGARVMGMEYAMSGQAASFGVETGAVEALVQGRAPRPYAVKLTLPHLSHEEWVRVVQEMAREAVFAAKLLVGEMPASIGEPFSVCGASLLPAKPAELKVECTCGEKLPCKHVVAVTCLLAERLEVDPLAVFALRGLPGTTLLERLQEARTVQTTGVTQSHQSPQLPTQKAKLPPLEACLDDFWRPGRKFAEFERLSVPSHVPHALLRRLGASPLGGKFPLVGLLASVHDSLRTRAIELRERIDGAGPA
jgi:uncharacterized Zn finger protein